MNLITLRQYIRLATELPFGEVLKRAARKSKNAVTELLMRRRDRWNTTYEYPSPRSGGGLFCRFPEKGLPVPSSSTRTTLLAITNLYLNHRFDLLGSGWIMVCHGMECAGLEGHKYSSTTATVFDRKGEWLAGRINQSNLSYSQRIWSLLDPEYLPIDWHIDFKSGYRWKENTWFKDIAFGHLPGVDIKVPWELARMQHLPQLAQAHACALVGHEGFSELHIYIREFRNQVLDFIALNPPRFGVNWVCSMDVGIRVSNWLIAYDLFVSNGACFDEEFNKIFMMAVYQHGQHIINNLEWHPMYRGNHYLANILGLLFVSSYLDLDDITDSWLAFSISELINEVGFQFFEDGSNFEASTSYHRLSAELVVYGTALILGLPDNRRIRLSTLNRHNITHVPPLDPKFVGRLLYFKEAVCDIFPDWYWERLKGMAEFTLTIMRPDGQSPQIGDNDSGRLFKLTPIYEVLSLNAVRRRYENLAQYDTGDEVYMLERQNDHRHLFYVVYALYEHKKDCETPMEFMFEVSLIEFLAKKAKRSINDPLKIKGELPSGHVGCGTWLEKSIPQSYEFSIPANESDSLERAVRIKAYPDFGLYLYKSSNLYLAIRCGPVGLNGLGAHAHNDPLSIELWINGKPMVLDPGTYLYTPLPSRRDEFRSISAHFSPRIDNIEPGSMSHGTFRLGGEAKPECLHFSEREFFGRYSTGTHYIYRHISIGPHNILIKDWACGAPGELIRLDPGSLPYSHGYGWRCSDRADRLV